MKKMNLKRKSSLYTIIPIFFSIGVYVTITAAMYALLGNTLFYTNLYDAVQSIGVIFLGYLSDRFCRRKTALCVEWGSLVLLLIICIFPTSFWLIILSGLLYNPISIFKAALVDNFPRLSKVQLISLAFVFQIFPWCFYEKITRYSPTYLLHLAFALLLISALLTLIFFYDKRDRLSHSNDYFSLKTLVHTQGQNRFTYTILAFIPAQIVYLLADNLLDNYSQNPTYYSILSAAGLVGVFLPLLYRKTPHVSVLTITYGICMTLASIPILSLYIFSYPNIGLPIQLILFSCLSSFSLPFVYDIVLNAMNAQYRGLACGILESLYSFTSIINLAFVHFFTINLFITFFLIILLYTSSTLLQKRAE